MACEMREGMQGRKPMGLLCAAVFDKCSRICGGTMVWSRSDAVFVCIYQCICCCVYSWFSDSSGCTETGVENRKERSGQKLVVVI